MIQVNENGKSMRRFVIACLILLMSSAALAQMPSKVRSTFDVGAGFGQQASLREWSSVGLPSAGTSTSGRFALSSGPAQPLTKKLASVTPSAATSPGIFLLHQNYPNPFNPSTTIKFELPRASQVTLRVYDVLGREVSLLVNERKDAGVYEVKFDGWNLASGVFFYRLQTGTEVQTKKLVLMK
jgi:hypothetical protein